VGGALPLVRFFVPSLTSNPHKLQRRLVADSPSDPVYTSEQGPGLFPVGD
jgi:hypothetical protein